MDAFLKAGEPPIYIGFGSVVVEDAAAMTRTIFDAVEASGTRALVSAGWGGLGGTDVPDSVFILKGGSLIMPLADITQGTFRMIGYLRTVGSPQSVTTEVMSILLTIFVIDPSSGAGTTAIGLRNGLPTIVVPFFGDQQ